jgi:hypothetical protein
MHKELKISKTLLQHQYATMKITEIMDYYGICNARLYSILDQCGIERKRIRNPRREINSVVITD